MSATTGVRRPGAPAIRRSPSGLETLRRDFRRSRRVPAPERWSGDRLREQLPRLSLGEALEILSSGVASRASRPAPLPGTPGSPATRPG
jgi:hypothetical protein